MYLKLKLMEKSLVFFGLLLPVSVSFAASSINTDINSETQQLQRHIYMLEIALAPATPEAVATTWAQAAKSRNGAVQYMLMCPNLQKANLATLKALNWVTGVSSPWISSYKIISQKNKLAFNIQYQFSAGGGKAGSSIDHIKMIKINQQADSDSSQQWCVSQFDTLSPVDKL
jgi:hypothetical protein